MTDVLLAWDFLTYAEEEYDVPRDWFTLCDFLEIIRPFQDDWIYQALEIAVDEELLSAAEVFTLILHFEQDPLFLDPPDCRRVLEAAFIRKYDTAERLEAFFEGVYDAEERAHARVLYMQLFYELILDRDF